MLTRARAHSNIGLQSESPNLLDTRAHIDMKLGLQPRNTVNTVLYMRTAWCQFDERISKLTRARDTNKSKLTIRRRVSIQTKGQKISAMQNLFICYFRAGCPTYFPDYPYRLGCSSYVPLGTSSINLPKGFSRRINFECSSLLLRELPHLVSSSAAAERHLCNHRNGPWSLSD
jgi:hypothetical protein